MKRTVAIFTGNRSEYGLFYPILKQIAADERLVYKLLVSGAHLKENYGKTLDEIKKDGFEVHHEIHIKSEDDTLRGTTLGLASSIENTSKCLAQLRPDLLVIYADRFESFGALIAGTQLGIPTAHIEGGDYTEGGALDDSVRHAMTKLAHLHFTTNEPAAERVRKLGEEKWRVFNVGSPSLDLLKEKNFASLEEIQKRLPIDPEKPILIFTQHSVAIEFNQGREQIIPSLQALQYVAEKLGCQIIATYPNDDAGGEAMIEELEKYNQRNIPNFHVKPSLGRYLYHGILNIASAYLGNSSSGIKETPGFYCPCINIGDRQKGRLRANNIIEVNYNKFEIINAIKKALNDVQFKEQVNNCNNPYGAGDAGKQIADLLASIPIDDCLLKKKMTY